MKYSEIKQTLFAAGIEEATYEAKLLLKQIAKLELADIVADKEADSEELKRAVELRTKRVPLQYILGEVGFFKELYRVNEGCLIPRSDTERLVEYAVGSLDVGSRFLDLCTGSGCIAISTLKNTRGTTAVAVDISDEALAIAKGNADINGVCERLTLLKADLMSDTDTEELADGLYDAILSNPPYVTEEEYASLEKEIYYEPKIAFVAKCNGLEFYERIISRFKDSLKKGGFFALEIGYSQGRLITELAAENGFTTEIIKDYSGKDRVAVLKAKKIN